jgi:hypothetical protein
MATAIAGSAVIRTLSTNASLPIQIRITKSRSDQTVRLRNSVASAGQTRAVLTQGVRERGAWGDMGHDTSLAQLPRPIATKSCATSANQAGPPLVHRLAATGMKVAIVKRTRFDSTSVNIGCAPDLVASAYTAHLVRRRCWIDVSVIMCPS